MSLPIKKPVQTENPPYFGILRKYVKKGVRPWSRERDGDSTAAAWARSEMLAKRKVDHH